MEPIASRMELVPIEEPLQKKQKTKKILLKHLYQNFMKVLN